MVGLDVEVGWIFIAWICVSRFMVIVWHVALEMCYISFTYRKKV